MNTAPVFMQVPVFSALGNLGFALRRQVFVIEQQVPPELEHDADDLTATHCIGLLEGDVVAVARILFKPEHAKIGRVAVPFAMRGRGIGAGLIAFAIETAQAQGQPRVYIESQSDKTGFYERLGFTVFGQPFMDAGIPHRAMKNY